jgi:hypothetical protein
MYDFLPNPFCGHGNGRKKGSRSRTNAIPLKEAQKMLLADGCANAFFALSAPFLYPFDEKTSPIR